MKKGETMHGPLLATARCRGARVRRSRLDGARGWRQTIGGATGLTPNGMAPVEVAVAGGDRGGGGAPMAGEGGDRVLQLRTGGGK
jgi:hypothetical protein